MEDEFQRRQQKFHEHLEACVCMTHPFDLCPIGLRFLAVTVQESRKECVLGTDSRIREDFLCSQPVRPEEITDLVSQRDRARREGNFQLADEIRDRLLYSGIRLRDSKNGTTWIDCDQ